MREMKDSGVEWIGEIPETWIVERLQWHLDEIKESNSPIKTTQVLSLTNKAGVIPYEDKGEQGNKAKENYDEYKLAYPDTIVANSMNILIGSVGICRYFGCVSPVYYVFKPKENELLSYLNYVFQMEQFQKELRRYANGILEIRLRLSSANIIKRYVAFPSHEEQIAISHFLDRKCTQIDALISNAQQQIEKLKAYKQSVITETVTKGLDPDVKMKDSGVEWIGEIPEHWGTPQIKHIATISSGSTPNRNNDYISLLINEAICESQPMIEKYFDRYKPKFSNNNDCINDTCILLPIDTGKKAKELYREVTKKVICSDVISVADSKSEYIIKQLFKAFCKHPRQLPDYVLSRYYSKQGVKYDRIKMDEEKLRTDSYFIRIVCDHIAGMTDQFASREYRRLYLPDY